ncbi:uncharacterized protein G2W53_039790 [Senna tora]|uniref:Uncharacterized protein n=1 Tax=Senna tora TaxID=362788 RepID=A0A834T1U1_9FABA|nr:uncharacterized protein G2W53_039790 [Senna tora]
MEQLRYWKQASWEELKGLNLAWDCKPATFLKYKFLCNLLLIIGDMPP